MPSDGQALESTESAAATVSAEEMALHLAGGTAVDWRHAVEHFGASTGWLRRAAAEWTGAQIVETRSQRVRQLAAAGEVQREFERCARAGIRLVSHRAADYPQPLQHLHQPPVLLTVLGRWPVPEAALAVVGARAATPYGRHVTTLLAGAASRAGHAIVSGLARGIDRFALDAALADRGWPVGVLGCGLDVAYPPEHRELQDTIATRGTLISEFPLGQRPDKFTFPRRNRIIAALCRQVLVVEAGPRSGALITARHAADIGREVLAVPGPIDVETSRGTNQLIFDGAVPILDAPLLLFALGAGAAAAGNGGASPGTAGSDPMLAALGNRALSLDELSLETGIDVRNVRSALIALELEGMIRRLEGGRYVRRQPGGAAFA